ncbi:histidine kinase [Paenibacillus alginolyticus]|uniref:Histidine kinase n=1 Tax=Paenibacillus alginolyticus TaxID=59839 RepID=A0ABT4GK83_9BACL|nr:sensor histidine kinase [Paenibacillus alginolyticus]MCY9670184.1 histidine kinase [Paenibacillus alginolyticus]MCY9696612.1 histidine kinase [Paenibacillus alginolyticus]MEC0145223.1 histidine kinase [Paenibacillus alginolyticus]
MHPVLQSLKQRMENLSLKHKLFILLVSISILPITLVSYSSQYFMFRSSTEYTSSISTQYVEFLSQDISTYLQDLSQSFDDLFTNSDFQKYLDTPVDDLTSQANHIINFRPILKTPLQFRSEILGVLYLDQMGKVYFDSFQKGLNYGYPFQEDVLYNTFYQMDKPELTVPHAMNYTQISQDNVFSLVRPIINLNTGKIAAWFVIEIREDKIKKMLRGTKYGQEGHLLLYHDTIGTAVSNFQMDSSLLHDFKHSLDSELDHNKEFIFSSQNVKYEATYADIPYGDWKLVWMAPLSSMTKGAQQANHLTIFIAFISLAVALIIAYPVMRFVLLPLFKLKDGMKSLGRGAYVPIKIQHSNDEIGFLIKSYNQTLNELEIMEEEVYQSKIKEKERELLQLQAQINPHFVFNTLETIESYAIRNNGEAVGDMVQSVSRMMRYTVRNDGGWSPLKEEMAYIRNFLNIHYYRNGKDVMAKFDIDPALLDVPIMKLSIQPFVENAIKYGWSPNMSAEEFLLTVKVKIEGDFMRIMIQNTGTHIPSTVMDKLSTMILSKGEKLDPYFQKHTGIYNVYRRFLLAYGDSIEISITSLPIQGTLIDIRVPRV